MTVLFLYFAVVHGQGLAPGHLALCLLSKKLVGGHQSLLKPRVRLQMPDLGSFWGPCHQVFLAPHRVLDWLDPVGGLCLSPHCREQWRSSGMYRAVPSLPLQVDGVLCLADILTDDSHSEATRAEAAAVVAQVTSPHLPFTQHLSSFLESMEEIVTALVSESPWAGGDCCVRGTCHSCLQRGPKRPSCSAPLHTHTHCTPCSLH